MSQIWTCACGGEGVAFYPGSEPEIVPGGIVIDAGEPARVLCMAHFQRAFGPRQRDLLECLGE